MHGSVWRISHKGAVTGVHSSPVTRCISGSERGRYNSRAGFLIRNYNSHPYYNTRNSNSEQRKYECNGMQESRSAVYPSKIVLIRLHRQFALDIVSCTPSKAIPIKSPSNTLVEKIKYNPSTFFALVNENASDFRTVKFQAELEFY